MNTNQEYSGVKQMKAQEFELPYEQLTYGYPEKENQMAMGGSSQVLGDFFEFTDYLTPCSRIIMKYRHSRPSVSEDFYSGLLGF